MTPQEREEMKNLIREVIREERAEHLQEQNRRAIDDEFRRSSSLLQGLGRRG